MRASRLLTFLMLAPLGFVVSVVGCGSITTVADGGPDGAAGSTGTAGAGGHAGGSSGTAGQAGGSGTAGAGGGTAGSGGRGGATGAGGSTGTAGAGGTAGKGGAGGGGACVCSAIYAPVCGVNGQTYPSACEAACANVAVAHTGVCTTDAGTDGPKPAGYCEVNADCVFRSNVGCCGSCTAVSDPVAPQPQPVCAIACPAIVPSCGCVNHKCTAASACGPAPAASGGPSDVATPPVCPL